MRPNMKLPRKTHNTSNSCSCTSCIYKSESDRPSLQRLVLKKSKIDRLYYGKYIPLREKKLLDKLVRTRAVYDDIRAQLISDSGSSLQKNADFKAKTSRNELKKSGDILEIVNLVDKGAALKSPNLSECCSCCSCSSKSHLHQNIHSRKLHQRMNARGDHYEREGLRYNMKNRRGVRFLPKHIKSDPCTCTFQFLGFGNKNANLDSNIESSLNIDEEIQPRPRRTSLIFGDSKTNIKNKITEGLQKIKDSKTMLQDSFAIRAKESLDRIKHMKNKLKPLKNVPEDDMYILESRKVTILKDAGRPSYEKIKESQTRLKNTIIEGGNLVEIRARKSMNKLKQTKNKINTNVKSSVDRMILKKKPKKKLNLLSPEEQNKLALKIRKDSIVKFKENLNKKKHLKDWICEESCIEGTCDPKECFQKLKFKRALKDSRHLVRRDKITHSKTKHHEKNVGISSNSSNVIIQTKPWTKASKMQQNRSKGGNKQLQVKPALSIKKLQNKLDKKRSTKPQVQKKEAKSSKEHPKLKSQLERETNPRQVVRIGSSFSFNVTFYKENSPDNMISSLANDRKSQSSGLTLSRQSKRSTLRKGTKRSQVSFKLLKRELAKKSTKHRPTDLQKSVQCQCTTVRKNKQFNLLPFECEPSICIPGECDPDSCLKLIKKRLATHSKQSYTSSRKTKSTSSVTTKSKTSKAKQVQSAVIPLRKDVMDKQKLKLRPRKVIHKPKLSSGNIVRIGSSFNFNIEFYKNSNLHNHNGVDNWQGLNTFSIKPKTKRFIQDTKPKKGIKKEYHKERKQNRKTSTTGTETVDNSDYFIARDKSTGSNKYQLQPYECIPGTCITGECNPYECLEIIKKRYKTREVSLGTLSPDTKSTYSYTKSRSKAAFVQSKPSTKGRKILVKSKIDSKIRKPNFGSIALKNNAKQVVNVGSSFSFNIEFSKSYKSNDIGRDIKSSAKPINFSTKKKVKERGVEIEKTVGHVDTQIEKVKNTDKSSFVGPMLKRCFCTLNLYKKQKLDFNKYKKLPFKNNVFTVNTALVQRQYHSSVNLIKNNYDGLLEKENIHLVPCTKHSTKQSLEITSGLSSDVKIIKNSQLIAVKSSSNYIKMKSPSIIGLNNYLKRCFCTMNVQYDSKLSKLEPYECEPGVCIPGECDPYECQKLIMKRLLKRYSKLSSTDSKSISISSSQTQKKPTQSHFTSAASKRRQIDKQRYRPKVLKAKEAKQAVRIGSSFSFDVEFYKNRPRSEMAKSNVNITTSGSVEKSKGTPKIKFEKHKNKQIYTKPDIQESDSQANVETKHKESYALDQMNRCFCTLKLHKKGKVKTSIGQNQTAPQQQTEIASVSRGQNTKRLSRDQNLLAYECEPGICIPGECNPYECLARINKKMLKETGVATIPTSITTSANTITANKTLKTRSVKVEQIKSKIQPIQRIRGSSVRKLPRKSQNTRRQAVKIGSTFSFNIDFYKDATNSERARKKEDTKQNKRKPTQTKIKETQKKGRKMSTTIRPSHAKVLQTVQSPHKNMATMVKPFLKRCFCTLQLRNQRNAKIKSNKIKEKKYRSVMTMTDKNKHKRKLDPNECEPGICIPYKCDPFECEQLIKNRYNEEINGNMSPNPKLLPYECEPNFCIPGKCDPYVCLEHIKKRNKNIKSTGIVANDIKRTLGHTYSTSIQNKHKKLQSQKPSVGNTLRIPTLKNITSQRNGKASDANNKQALKIGSDISFNVEFYKNKSIKRRNGSRTHSDFKMHLKPLQKSQKSFKQKLIQEGKRHSTNKSQTLANSKSTKSGIIPHLQRCFCTLSLRKNLTENVQGPNAKEEEIQTVNQSIAKKSVTKNIEPTKSTVSAVSTFIKKCFCTLKLNTRKVPNSPQVKLEINPHKLKSKFVKLEPYECEPNTCIPGECDPFECEKRIRKRLLRESAVEPIRLKQASKPTLTPTMRANNISRATLAPLLKSKNGYTTRVSERRKKSSSVKNVDKFKVASLNQGQSKQSVRIGSSFSFDIEFFKDKSGGHGDTPYYRKTKHRPKKLTVKEDKKQKYTEKTIRNSKNGRTQGTTIRFGKHNSSQLTHVQTKSNSTLTDPLKRCFCTLQLHKNAAANNQNVPNQKQPLQISSQNKMANTTISYKMTAPYECPPLMCIPNQCDPYNCERKLKKLRNQGIGPKKTKRIHQSLEVGQFPKHKKSQKTQSYMIKKLPTHDHDQNIVEIPRFTNYLKKENWQGVKIGSNMSFNIEFYKELSTPSPVNIRKLKSKDNKLHVKSRSLKDKQFGTSLVRKSRLTDKVVPSKRSNVRNNESQVNKNRIDSKSSNTTNKLKRCFCTLKLQKTNTPHVPYPQAFEVRRAVVKKGNTIKETHSQVKCVNMQGICRKIKSHSREAHAKDNEMQTILSYKPKKFNKKCSETLLMDSNIRIQSNKKRITWSSKKRLTKKPSAHPINVPSKPCPCQIITTQIPQKTHGPKKSKRQTPSDDIIRYYSDRRAKRIKTIHKIRTSKSLMLPKKSSNKHAGNNVYNLVGNQFEAGDSKGKHIKFGCQCRQKNNKNKITKQLDDTNNKERKDSNNKSKKRFLTEKPKTETIVQKDGPCPYCGQCVKGGIGYFLLAKFNTCVQKIKQWSFQQTTKTIVALKGQRETKAKELKPLFNVYLDSDGMGIINKEEVTEKVTRFQTKSGRRERELKKNTHDKFCTCCICLGKKDKKKKGHIKKSHKEKDEPICVCGSEACAKNVKRMKKLSPKKKVVPPCFCGSPICAEETATMDAIAQGSEAACICQEEYKKIKEKAKEENAKKFKLLSAKHRKEDSERQKKRRKADQLVEESIRGNKNDALLVAESVVDVAKLGFTGISDIFRIVYRCARDPKYTWNSMKAMAKDPSLIAKNLKETYSNSGFSANTKRIGMRISNMGSMEKTKQLLEQHAVTNYLLHMADPKKRLRKRKKKPKPREQIDFNCNLYVSSLRKRPFMWIFNRWPSFYPHCLSFLNVWKQFAEVMTFLLAVVVWSPCIFAMEVCRAVICCTLCTG